uniref:GRF-type domain-containing protein n=1 Tax=Arundo donax TaxID=35708 RepID=A0A0A9AR35_ARUDO
MSTSSAAHSKGTNPSSSSWSLQFPPSGLSLIQCPNCKKENVLELTATTTKNYGRKFFKCPRNQRALPNRCRFYMFQQEYEELLGSMESTGGIVGVNLDVVEQHELGNLQMELEEVKKELALMKNSAQVLSSVASMVAEMHGWGKCLVVLACVNVVFVMLSVIVLLVR